MYNTLWLYSRVLYFLYVHPTSYMSLYAGAWADLIQKAKRTIKNMNVFFFYSHFIWFTMQWALCNICMTWRLHVKHSLSRHWRKLSKAIRHELESLLIVSAMWLFWPPLASVTKSQVRLRVWWGLPITLYAIVMKSWMLAMLEVSSRYGVESLS